MIIDVNTYVGHWPFRSVKNTTLEERMKQMDEKGIDIACVSSLNAIFYRDAQSGNEELVQEMKLSADYSKRFIPFCIINPMYPGWEKDFDICVNDFSMKGLELYPAYHNYSLNDPQVSRLLMMAQQKKIPVLLPCAIENLRQRHYMDTKEDLNPDDVVKMAQNFKELDIIISNGPTPVFASKLSETVKQRTGRIFYDYTRVELLNSTIDRFVEKAGVDNVVFGTASPMQYVETQYSKLYNSKLSEDDKNKILSGNLKQLFKIR